MLIEKWTDLVSAIAKKQKDCEFSLRFFLERDVNAASWKNCFTVLKLAKEGTVSERMFDYGNWLFGEKVFDMKKGLEIILGMIRNDSGKPRLMIPGHVEFGIEGKWGEIVSSRARMFRTGWPAVRCRLHVPSSQLGQNENRKLLSEGLPYYPNGSEAIIDLFDLEVESFSRPGEIHIVVPDYRARIESLKLRFSEAELKIQTPEIELNELTIKVFAKTGTKAITLPDIHPESDLTEFQIGSSADTLSVVLFSIKENRAIDWIDFTKWSLEKERIIVERPVEEIVSLARAGESQNLEYKYDILDPNGKNDFIESVIAFLNSNRGIILVGVDDKGEIVGSKQSKDSIQKLIHDSCSPPPRDIRVEKKEIEENRVLIIEVPEGDNKPYQSRRDRNFYVRHNGNDMKMELSELIGNSTGKDPSKINIRKLLAI